MKSRKLTRRRTMNFRQPREDDVDKSVSRIVNTARRRANVDHGWSFASERERDRIAEVYLSRAMDELKESLG